MRIHCIYNYIHIYYTIYFFFSKQLCYLHILKKTFLAGRDCRLHQQTNFRDIKGPCPEHVLAPLSGPHSPGAIFVCLSHPRARCVAPGDQPCSPKPTEMIQLANPKPFTLPGPAFARRDPSSGLWPDAFPSSCLLPPDHPSVFPM